LPAKGDGGPCCLDIPHVTKNFAIHILVTGELENLGRFDCHGNRSGRNRRKDADQGLQIPSIKRALHMQEYLAGYVFRFLN
jgi:hypothetical protein